MTTPLDRFVSALSQMTPGPYRWTSTEPMTIDQKVEFMRAHFEKGKRDTIDGLMSLGHPGTVIGSEPNRPEFAVLVCLTGDGDDSPLNAQALEVILTDAPILVAEVERLRAEAEAEERSHGQTIDERDALHERIDEIADALGDETEWSNVNDRGANAVELAQEALGRLVDLRLIVEPVRSWFDGDGEIATPSDVEIAKMAVEELQKDREWVLRLRAAMNQIISTTSEPVIRVMAERALKS